MSIHTIVLSPGRELEPGTRLQGSFTLGERLAEGTAVTLRVAFEAEKTPSTGSTLARWIVSPGDEIEFAVELPRSEVAQLETLARPPASSHALRLLEETRFPGFVRHLFALRALVPEAAFPEWLLAQLDRLFIKLRLPNYVISDRDIETAPQTWIELARRIPAGEFPAYRESIIVVLEQFSEPTAFLDALQQKEFFELDALLDRIRT